MMRRTIYIRSSFLTDENLTSRVGTSCIPCQCMQEDVVDPKTIDLRYQSNGKEFLTLASYGLHPPHMTDIL